MISLPTATDRYDWKPMQTNHQLVDDHVYLIGRPSLRQFLDYVVDLAVDGGEVDSRALNREWRAAAELIRRLEKEEAGWADHPAVAPLPAHLEPLRAAVLNDPLFQHAFNVVPADIGMVELDRLVVYQKQINLEFVQQLVQRLGPTPTEEEVFRTCLPFDHPQPLVRWTRVHSDTYEFYSPSNDLRFLGSMPLGPSNITDYPPPGALAGVVGLGVGFGSNFLNALSAEDRLVLNNGSHRAFAMRELGITHVPCIIERCSNREELKAVASSDLRRNPDRYLKHPRPSLLKDYFDPRLRRIVPIPRRIRRVRVKFEVDEDDVLAMGPA
ncbi:MAG: hypothetical protein ACYDH9_15085 [Limisphaerales bacterium]